MTDIDLRCCSADSLLLDMFNRQMCADTVFADPPWSYDNGNVQGGAIKKYDLLDIQNIAQTFHTSYAMTRPNSYAVLWCTYPKLEEWMLAWNAKADQVVQILHDWHTWQYITGETWGKVNGLGPGFHLRGDAEPILLYKKGQPKPLTTQSNLILDRRVGHSEKPQEALQAFIELTTPTGGLVLDLYAGESASLARACRATGRRYIGAELSPERHKRALDKLALAEQSTFWGWRRVEPIAQDTE